MTTPLRIPPGIITGGDTGYAAAVIRRLVAATAGTPDRHHYTAIAVRNDNGWHAYHHRRTAADTRPIHTDPAALPPSDYRIIYRQEDNR